MALSRTKHSTATKVKVALEILPEAFSSKRKRKENDQQALVDELYKQIGQLKVENDFLKKNINHSA